MSEKNRFHTPNRQISGMQIAFDSQSAIYVVGADGSGKKRLASGTHPVWSPQ